MSSAKYILVRWIEDETLSIRPSSAVSKGINASVGALGDIKFGRVYYQGEILAISGEYSI